MDDRRQHQREFEDGLWTYEEALALWVFYDYGSIGDFIRRNGKGDEETMKAMHDLLAKLRNKKTRADTLRTLEKRQRAWCG